MSASPPVPARRLRPVHPSWLVGVVCARTDLGMRANIEVSHNATWRCSRCVSRPGEAVEATHGVLAVVSCEREGEGEGERSADPGWIWPGPPAGVGSAGQRVLKGPVVGCLGVRADAEQGLAQCGEPVPMLDEPAITNQDASLARLADGAAVSPHCRPHSQIVGQRELRVTYPSGRKRCDATGDPRLQTCKPCRRSAGRCHRQPVRRPGPRRAVANPVLSAPA